MSTGTSIDRLGEALDATGQLIAGVRQDQWSNPTPCSEWDLRALVNHLVIGSRIFADLLRGEPLPQPDRMAQLRASDQLGDNPASAYAEASAALQAAFSQPGVLDQVFQSPIGPAPGAVLVHVRTVETLVHGWDVAHASGQPAALPDQLSEQELAFTRRQLGVNVPRSRQFGSEQPVAADAPAIDRLAAFMGRSVQAVT